LPTHPHPLAGNWGEDEARFDLAARDYEVRRTKGELLHLRKAREKAFQTQPVRTVAWRRVDRFIVNCDEPPPPPPHPSRAQVPHAYHADGLVHYGDTVQLAVDAGGCRYLLADNIFSSVAPGLIRVTGAAAAGPQVRNTFVVERERTRGGGGGGGGGAGAAAAAAGDDGGPLLFGDRIVLACNPALTVDPATRIVGLQYLLQSQRANNVVGTGKKGRQDATMSTKRGADAVWVVTAPSMDPGDRLGEPVAAGEDVALVHAMSAQALAGVAGETTPTDFGDELDVHVQLYRKPGRVTMGSTGDLAPQPAEPANRWKFVLAEAPDAADDARGFRPLTADALVERARTAIARACGLHGLRSLSLGLAALDERGTGRIPTEAAKYALFDHGALLTEDEFKLLMGAFDHGGYVVPAELMEALRGDAYSGARQGMVREAYAAAVANKAERLSARAAAAASLSTTGGAVPRPAGGAGGGRGGHGGARAAAGPVPAATPGVLSVSEVKALYDAKFDVRVHGSGEMTAVEAAAEFERQWPQHPKPDAPVSVAQFVAYYADVSAAVPDDFDFVEMVSNTWHVPGRGTWKAKKSKKVLVTFHKGSSTEVVIPEAEDIPDDDFEGLAAALKTLGFGGIARVKVLSMFDAD